MARGKGVRRPFQVITIDVQVAEGVNKFADFEVADVSDQVR